MHTETQNFQQLYYVYLLSTETGPVDILHMHSHPEIISLTDRQSNDFKIRLEELRLLKEESF